MHLLGFTSDNSDVNDISSGQDDIDDCVNDVLLLHSLSFDVTFAELLHLYSLNFSFLFHKLLYYNTWCALIYMSVNYMYLRNFHYYAFCEQFCVLYMYICDQPKS